MKKIIVLTLMLTILITSFAFAGIVAADENAEHLCIYTGFGVSPGIILTANFYDVNGDLMYTETFDTTNLTSFYFPDTTSLYLPMLNGFVDIIITVPGFGTFSNRLATNDLSSGVCFNDFRLNSRPDRDLAAPVAIYLRFADNGDGFDGFDVYDINQFAGTGVLSLRVTEAELNDAADEAVASGANITVAQEGDVIFTVLASSTADEAICQVNAVDSEGKPYEYQWTCLS